MHVIRNGEIKQIHVKDMLVGDILSINIGINTLIIIIV